MNWLILALGTVICYSIFDYFVKLSSDKIHSGLGTLMINVFSLTIPLLFVIYSYFQGQKVFEVKSGGYLYSALAGLVIGLAGVFFIKMFSLGVNLSVGVPLVRIGIVIGGSLLGIMLLKEGFNSKYLAGVMLSLVGLYLIITAR